MRKYDVALSFAGEQRVFVREVAKKLIAKRLKIFFDEHDQHKALGHKPFDYFGEIYSEKAYLVVLFVSKEYIKKPIPKHEAKCAIENNENSVIVFRFDDVHFDGLESKIYIDIGTRKEEDIADSIENVLYDKGFVFENDKDKKYEAEHTPIGGSKIEFSFFDYENNPIEYGSIYSIRKDLWKNHHPSNTYKEKEIYSFYCADDNQCGLYIKNITNGTRVVINGIRSNNAGSLVGSGWIKIPTSNFEINPIVDNLNRRYFYGKNIRCNNENQRPFNFNFGQELKLENFDGYIQNIKILHGFQDLFLIEYKKSV